MSGERPHISAQVVAHTPDNLGFTAKCADSVGANCGKALEANSVVQDPCLLFRLDVEELPLCSSGREPWTGR